MHRRSLPIADPCDAFRPSPGRTFCDKCQTHVHDLSAMTRSDAKRLLAANVGRRMCVAYRTAADGTIIVLPDPDPRPIGLALVMLGLAACTGYAPEMQHPDEQCRDAQGYEIDCNPARRETVVIPDAEPSEPDPAAAELFEVPGTDPLDELASVDALSSVGLIIPDAIPMSPPLDLVSLQPPPPDVFVGVTFPEGGLTIAGATVAGELLDRLPHDRRSRREARRAARRERRASR